MSPEESAQEILKRESEQPGRFPADVVARAKTLLSGPAEPGPGVVRLPEQTITPRSRLEKFGDAASSILRPAAVAADNFSNAMLLGIPHRVGTAPGDEQAAAQASSEYPKLAKVSDFAGAALSPVGRLGGGISLAESFLGRLASHALGAATGAGAYTGGRDLVEGKDLPAAASDAGQAALVGGAVGGGLGLLGEAARAGRGAIRRAVPDIARAEAGGAETSTLSAMKPGPELSEVQGAARAAGQEPVDYQANRLREPLTSEFQGEVNQTKQKIASDEMQYASSPEGQRRLPMDKLLQAYTDEHLSNTSADTGKPLVGANLSALRDNIKSLAKVDLVPPSRSDSMMGEPGVMRLSWDEATRRGFDMQDAVGRFAQGTGMNPQQAAALGRRMDVIVKPVKYNAEETLQAIRNVDAWYQKQNDLGQRVGGHFLAAAHSQNDSFPGLSELRQGHASMQADLERNGGLSQVENKPSANDEKALFNNIRGYGNPGRLPDIDQSLQALAGKADQANPGQDSTRNLELLKALKALDRIRAEGGAIPLQIRPSGRIGVALPRREALARLDPALGLLQQIPTPLGRAAGIAAGEDQ